MKLLILLLIPTLLFSESLNEAQKLEEPKAIETPKTEKELKREARIEKRKNRKVNVVPIPEFSSNPTFGTGGGAMLLMTYPVSKTDTLSPKSMLFSKISYYNTHSYIAMVANQFFLREDKFRIPLAGGQARLNNNFDYTFTFNTSELPADIPIDLPDEPSDSIDIPANLKYSSTSSFGYAGFNLNVWKRLYVGVDYFFMNIKNDEIVLKINEYEIPDSLIAKVIDLSDTKQSGFYLNAEWDSRDNQLNTLNGLNSLVQLGLFPKALGSTNTFETVTSNISYFHSFKPENHTLGAQVATVNTFGDVSGNNMASFGSGGAALRGYQDGKYRGRHLVMGQLEYRWYFVKRFGVVGFAGVGRFYGPEESLTTDEFLPSLGGGIRFMAVPSQRISIRLDAAWGRNGENGIYFGLAEAF
jgi:outer membrane protein assembly factor BamA